jgi:hypothetical protein
MWNFIQKNRAGRAPQGHGAQVGDRDGSSHAGGHAPALASVSFSAQWTGYPDLAYTSAAFHRVAFPAARKGSKLPGNRS